MGSWTTLTCYDVTAFQVAIGDDWFEPYNRISVAVEQGRLAKGHVVVTHRAWHAIHVALTGEETDGKPPASWVVGFEHGGSRALFNEVDFVHRSDTVRQIADHLRRVDLARAIEDLYAAIELGVYVYSFESWRGHADMVKSGFFAEVFEQVRSLYLGAALAGDLVHVTRG
ncbi:MAG TPA: DUF1877 family protein [Kofleriaceae bacterium]|jgi:hypothetical protein